MKFAISALTVAAVSAVSITSPSAAASTAMTKGPSAPPATGPTPPATGPSAPPAGPKSSTAGPTAKKGTGKSSLPAAKDKHVGADFSDLSFLKDERSLLEAEAARKKFLQRSMKLAEERNIKVKGYFNAKDQAETLRKAHITFKAAFGKAKSLAGAMKNLHLGAMKKALKAFNANKKPTHAFDLAVAVAKASKKRLDAITGPYEQAVAEFKETQNKLHFAKKEAKHANDVELRLQPLMAKAKKDHDGKVKVRKATGKVLAASRLLLKKANSAAAAAKAKWEKAELARIQSRKVHKTSLSKYLAAINRRAAAKAAAIKAHRVVKKHAKTGADKGFMYLAQVL